MGKSLSEYAALYPPGSADPAPQDIPKTPPVVASIPRIDEVSRLKASILRQIREGNAPQYILYAAVDAISILTMDTDWKTDTRAALDALYRDLAQASLLSDNEDEAAARREAARAEYNGKLRKDISRQIRGCKRIERALYAVLDALSLVEQEL